MGQKSKNLTLTSLKKRIKKKYDKTKRVVLNNGQYHVDIAVDFEETRIAKVYQEVMKDLDESRDKDINIDATIDGWVNLNILLEFSSLKLTNSTLEDKIQLLDLLVRTGFFSN